MKEFSPEKVCGSTTSKNLRSFTAGVCCECAMMSTFGMPLDVLKTHLAAHRSHSVSMGFQATWKQGGVPAFYKGLTFALLETYSGGILLLTQSETYRILQLGGFASWNSSFVSGMLAGCIQGIAMCPTTRFKTAEITRPRGGHQSSISVFSTARTIIQKEGLRGAFKGVIPLCLRQTTSWGCRFGFTGAYESAMLRNASLFGVVDAKLTKVQKVCCAIAGGLSTMINHPLEVIMVEMQSLASSSSSLSSSFSSPHASKNGTAMTTARYIFQTNGPAGFLRGASIRALLNCYVTVCMVCGGDLAKKFLEEKFN